MNQPITHSFRTQLLLFTGLLGFAVGVFELFNPKNQYHDIVFQPKAIVDTLLARKQRSLFPTPPPADSILKAWSAIRKIRRHDELDTSWPPGRDRLNFPFPVPYDIVRQKFDSVLLYSRIQQERRRIEDLTDTTLNGRYFVGSLFTDSKEDRRECHSGDGVPLALSAAIR